MKYRRVPATELELEDNIMVDAGPDLPQAFADEPQHEKMGIRRAQAARRDQKSDGNAFWLIPFFGLMIVVLVASYFLVSQHEENLIQHLKRDEQMHELAMSEEFDAEYSELQMENIKLKNELHESKALLKHQNYDNKPPGDLKKKIDELTSYKKKMQENIQLLSKTILLEKFGPGPHKVEIKVQFDPSSEIAKPTESGKDTGNIVIELAPVDDLPHVVYWFLEQVSRKLYDGCSFHRSAEHVIQGGPTPNFLSPANPGLQKRFKDSGFDSVLFQEYSAKHPHVKYTLGYAGRPGGPDFYISTMNNTKDHGPGGQTDYEDPTEADPCFAKVIEGFDVVDRMHKSPVNPGWYHGMAHNIAILSMRTL